MTDTDRPESRFERRLAAALRTEADESIGGFQPASVARAAIARRAGAARPAWVFRRGSWWPLATAAAAIAVAIAASLQLREGPGDKGPSDPPTPPSNASPAATTTVASAQPPIGAWTRLADMATARGYTITGVVLLTGQVLVMGGDDATRTAELYDPATGRWTGTGDTAGVHFAPTATLLRDGRVLLVGGFTERPSDDPNVAPDTVAAAELYDPTSGAWTTTGSMRQGRVGHTATLLADGRVLVTGGAATGGSPYERLNSAEIYDPGTGRWSGTQSMVQPRDSHTATLLPDGTVLVAGGHDGFRIGTAERYDPDSGTWTMVDDLPERFGGHTATLLRDGTVLLAGGDVPSGPGAAPSRHAVLFDPVTGTWLRLEDLLTARIGHGAALLGDGRVLISGGWFGNETPVADAELYDPATGRWLVAADLLEARFGHLGVVLPDGSVLVIGGAGDGTRSAGGDRGLATVERFDPLASR